MQDTVACVCHDTILYYFYDIIEVTLFFIFCFNCEKLFKNFESKVVYILVERVGTRREETEFLIWSLF